MARYSAFILCLIACGACLSSCATLNERRDAKLAGDLCHTRLPEAQRQLENLYLIMQDRQALTSHSRPVNVVGDRWFEVSTTRTPHGVLDVRGTRTGLSDLVISCAQRQCKLSAWLDGEVIPLRRDDRVELRCMSAGEHQLLVKQDDQVAFDGLLNLPSDHELTLTVERTRADTLAGDEARVTSTHLTFLPDRIPAIPVVVNQGIMQRGRTLASTFAPRALSEAVVTSELEARRQAVQVLARQQAQVNLQHARAKAAMQSVMTTVRRSPPMDAADFRTLRVDIKKQKYEKSRKDMLLISAQQNLFSCEQVGQLVKLFKYGDDQAYMVIQLFPRLTDPENISTVLDAIRYERDRAHVKKVLKL